jgi:hypothetical protein
MKAHARLNGSYYNESDLYSKLQEEMVKRYSIDEKLASEMAWDLIDTLIAVDGNVDIFEKYFLQ